jgi:hypothetical protein
MCSSRRGRTKLLYRVGRGKLKGDKEILVVPFNTGNHWVTLAISNKYGQVWYCDSSRPTDPITGDRLTRGWTDVMAVLNK